MTKRKRALLTILAAGDGPAPYRDVFYALGVGWRSKQAADVERAISWLVTQGYAAQLPAGLVITAKGREVLA